MNENPAASTASLSSTRPDATHRTRRTDAMIAVLWLLRVLTAAALAVDAYVHADLAPSYDFTHASISQGTLFRAEAAAASLAALLVLVAGRRLLVWAFAFLVAAAGITAVLLYRYVDVGAFGPFPDMYEPVWYAEKTRSAFAEGIGTVTALAGFLLAWRLKVLTGGSLRSRGRARSADRD